MERQDNLHKKDWHVVVYTQQHPDNFIRVPFERIRRLLFEMTIEESSWVLSNSVERMSYNEAVKIAEEESSERYTGGDGKEY